jgi:hypothetical protein
MEQALKPAEVLQQMYLSFIPTQTLKLEGKMLG